MTQKIACKKCGILILSRTFRKNSGLCMPCANGMRESIEKRKKELDLIKATQPHVEPEFICLECGSKQYRSKMRVIPISNKNDPWSKIHTRIECWDCGCIMPAQLCLRFNNLSIEEATRIWRDKYRPYKQSKIQTRDDAEPGHSL